MKRLKSDETTAVKLSEMVENDQIYFSDTSLQSITESSSLSLGQILQRHQESPEFQLTEGCILLLMEMNNIPALLALLEEDTTTDAIKLEICHYFKRYAKVSHAYDDPEIIQEKLNALVSDTLLRIVRKRMR
jgi:hypothetical protein